MKRKRLLIVSAAVAFSSICIMNVSACNKDTVNTEESFTGGSAEVSVSEVASSSDSSYQSHSSVESSATDLLQLEDGTHIVRLYLDPDCYGHDESGATVQIGVERYEDEYKRFYSDDDIGSLSVGDTFSPDEDIGIKIRSTTVEDNKMVNKAWYEAGEYFIRISDHYIFVHPQDTGDGIYQDIKDYWLLGRLNDYGNYDYIGKFVGKTTLHIADDCRIAYYENEWLPANEEEIAKGNPYEHIIKAKDLPDFMAGFDKEKIVFYRGFIKISDGKIVDIDFGYDDAEYYGG